VPYFITDQHPDCPLWATVKEDGESIGCHETEQDAIDQMVAVSSAEEMEPGGTYEGDFRAFVPLDLSAPAWVRAIARRSNNEDPVVVAVSQGNMTPAMWGDVRDIVSVEGATLWGAVLSERTRDRLHKYADDVVDIIVEQNEGRAKGQAVSKMETRTNQTTFEVRELDESGGMTFEGYASVFNSRSENLGGFHEVVAPGAFKRSLRSRNDIKLLWNHDTGSVLGSTRAGSVTMVEDEVGLKVRAELPNTTLGRDTAELIRTGLVDSMSFGFSVIKDTWDDTGTNRTLNAVRIHECSIVSFPAYQGTAGTVSMRGLDRVAQRASVDVDELADALLKIESGDELSSDEAALLSRVVDELKPEDKEPEIVGDLGLLALKKKKLELLERY